MVERRAYIRQNPVTRQASITERLDDLKAKLVNKELRLLVMAEEIIQLKMRIAVEELILNRVPEKEKASA